MSKRYTNDELIDMLTEATRVHGNRVYRHIESGSLYLVIGAAWSTDLQAPVLAYAPLGQPGVIFIRDARVFDGAKFEAVEVQA